MRAAVGGGSATGSLRARHALFHRLIGDVTVRTADLPPLVREVLKVGRELYDRECRTAGPRRTERLSRERVEELQDLAGRLASALDSVGPTTARNAPPLSNVLRLVEAEVQELSAEADPVEARLAQLRAGRRIDYGPPELSQDAG